MRTVSFASIARVDLRIAARILKRDDSVCVVGYAPLEVLRRKISETKIFLLENNAGIDIKHESRTNVSF